MTHTTIWVTTSPLIFLDGLPSLSQTRIVRLMKQNRGEVEKLKTLVADATPPSGDDGVWCKYDDLFFLR